MSWVTVIWSMVAGASLAMALPHVLIAVKQRGAWVNLLFAIAAVAVAGTAAAELAMMHAETTEQIGRAIQWVHVPVFVLVVAIFGFVRLYFGAGRLWLGGAACVLRLVTLVINFAKPPNLNFQEIPSLRLFEFLGEIIALPDGKSLDTAGSIELIAPIGVRGGRVGGAVAARQTRGSFSP